MALSETTIVREKCHSIGVTKVENKTVIGIDGMRFFITTNETTRDVLMKVLSGKVIENARPFIPGREDEPPANLFNLIFDGEFVNIITVF